MTDHNRTESAKWAIESEKVVGELQSGVTKALDDAAAKGFPAPPGSTLETILVAGQAAKGKLTEANGKIYDDRRKVLFEQDEFAMKVIVQLAKLGMELYREELMNALAIEQAENAALRDRGRADVERMNAEVDARQTAIIRDRAEMERRITVLKTQLVDAERVTLGSERALIMAQLATAEKKLEIIDSIYQVLAAEQLVLAAENRRAEALELVLAAQRIVARIKEAMIPFYQEKAEARLDLAQAIEDEIPIRKAIEELGYERIALENRKEEAAHLMREAEEELELAKAALTRANAATEFFRTQSRTKVMEYSNFMQTGIKEGHPDDVWILDQVGQIRRKDEVAREELSWKYGDEQLDAPGHITQRNNIVWKDEVEIIKDEIKNLGEELKAIIKGITDRARSQVNAIESSRWGLSNHHTKSHLSRKIVEGWMGW